MTAWSLTIAVALCLLSSCSAAQQLPADKQQTQSDRKILIVYLSRTNNTKAIAEFIQESVGGTLVALELEKPYPVDYEETVQQVAHENETGYLPPLKTKIEQMVSGLSKSPRRLPLRVRDACRGCESSAYLELAAGSQCSTTPPPCWPVAPITAIVFYRWIIMSNLCPAA